MNKKILKNDNVPKKLYEVGEREFFKKNDIIIHSGETIDYFYILVSGSILIISNTSDGSLVYHYLLIPPSIICEVHAIYKKEVGPTLKCLDDVEVIKISRNTILNLLKTDEEITRYMNELIFSYVHISSHQSIDYATLSSNERIANSLVEFAETLGEQIDGKIKINYKISQQFISNFTGVKKITTYRIFEKLKGNNILEYFDGYYYIKNLDLLKKFAST